MMDYLDFKNISLIYEDNKLIAKINNETIVIKALASFPFIAPNNYISLINENGEEIGMIKDINELNENDYKALEKELSVRYFIPEITAILKKREARHQVELEVITDKGEIKIILKADTSSSFRMLDNGSLIIKDIKDDYYQIKDFKNKKGKYINYLRSFI